MDILEFVKPSKLKRQKRRHKKLAKDLIQVQKYGGGKSNKKVREKGEKKKVQIERYKDSIPYRKKMKHGDMTLHSRELKSLKRYLRINSGKQWDEVYCNLMKHFSTKNSARYFVQEQLGYLVITDVFINKDGEIGYYGWSCSNGSCSVKEKILDKKFKRFKRFYVHPVSGILIYHLGHTS